MGTEFEPFIAGLPVGVFLGVATQVNPRVFAMLAAFVLLWLVCLLLFEGLAGLEQAALHLIHEVARHERMMLGLFVGAMLSVTVMRGIRDDDRGE